MPTDSLSATTRSIPRTRPPRKRRPAWIAHLQQRFGNAASGGMRYYALDNEPMLWNSTHRDVHPQPLTYDEIWQRTVDYASAIKAQDPGAKVFGPVTWGYCDLFGSAADNCLDGSDRAAHGGIPFVKWYLQQVCAYQAQHGVRLVDYLDLHYYPQGDGVVDFSDPPNGSETAAVSARRLRSLKELYDPAWQSESWLADLGNSSPWFYSHPRLIPRVRAWIDEACPGTGLAITEYNWGADNGASSALAQAEALAIFAREGVDVAARWVAPQADSLVERAFRLYLDFDGLGSQVNGDSVRAISADVDSLGAYAFHAPGQRVSCPAVQQVDHEQLPRRSISAPRSTEHGSSTSSPAQQSRRRSERHDQWRDYHCRPAGTFRQPACPARQ